MMLSSTVEDGAGFGATSLGEDVGRDQALLARGRVAPVAVRPLPLPEETVVVDDRTELTPAQAVENKLMALLREAPMPAGQHQSRNLMRGRGVW
jgi:hypothetical protein